MQKLVKPSTRLLLIQFMYINNKGITRGIKEAAWTVLEPDGKESHTFSCLLQGVHEPPKVAEKNKQRFEYSVDECNRKGVRVTDMFSKLNEVLRYLDVGKPRMKYEVICRNQSEGGLPALQRFIFARGSVINIWRIIKMLERSRVSLLSLVCDRAPQENKDQYMNILCTGLKQDRISAERHVKRMVACVQAIRLNYALSSAVNSLNWRSRSSSVVTRGVRSVTQKSRIKQRRLMRIPKSQRVIQPHITSPIGQVTQSSGSGDFLEAFKQIQAHLQVYTSS